LPLLIGRPIRLAKPAAHKLTLDPSSIKAYVHSYFVESENHTFAGTTLKIICLFSLFPPFPHNVLADKVDTTIYPLIQRVLVYIALDFDHQPGAAINCVKFGVSKQRLSQDLVKRIYTFMTSS